jgi:hypothetical protein
MQFNQGFEKILLSKTLSLQVDFMLKTFTVNLRKIFGLADEWEF